MMRDVFRQRWVAWRERVRRAIESRIVWHTDERRNLLGEPTHAPAFVAVIGREHYTERRAHYPIRGIRELERVLRFEVGGHRIILTTVGPFIDQRREVIFHEMHSDFDVASLRALVWLPESVVLAHGIATDSIVTVQRGTLRYFLAGSGASQIAGGVVCRADLFALALGVPMSLEDGSSLDVLLSNRLADRIKTGLRALGPLVWWRGRNPEIASKVREHWRPFAAVAGGAVLVYLVVASVYLAGITAWREHQLRQLGPEVTTLLDRQRLVARLAREQTGIGAIVAERRSTYRMWQVAAKVWEKGGAITAISLVDGRLTLRGVAPSATDILSSLTVLPDVSGAGFDAPTRQNGAQQDFVIRLTLRPESPRG